MISADEFLSHVQMPAEFAHDSASTRQRDDATMTLQGTQREADNRSPVEQERFEECKEAALRSLDAAPRSSADLAKRLQRKDFDEALIAEVIQRLQELGLLNDESYAEALLRYCLQRDMGERGVRMEMSRKGVDSVVSSRLIEEASQQGQFVDAAYALGRSVARRTQGMERKVRMRRFWSAGGRKGHSPDTLRKVFADVFD
jgi:regulatory protein